MTALDSFSVSFLLNTGDPFDLLFDLHLDLAPKVIIDFSEFSFWTKLQLWRIFIKVRAWSSATLQMNMLLSADNKWWTIELEFENWMPCRFLTLYALANKWIISSVYKTKKTKKKERKERKDHHNLNLLPGWFFH